MSKFELYGKNILGKEIEPNYKGIISKKFIVSPFTVLNTREGFWQERKKAWLKIGIKSELGRNKNLIKFSKSTNEYMYNKKEFLNKNKKSAIKDGGEIDIQTTSVFDPVLTELMYTWFCPKYGQIIDPFAGGSVRGIIAHILDRKYWGCDLSEKQIEANYEQVFKILGKNDKINIDKTLVWIIGDSFEELEQAPNADFIFSCPPYGNLEVYSNDPRDISNMKYSDFIIRYKQIIKKACNKLKDNSFACFVVGDFRDKNGNYMNFVSDTISAFRKQGLHLYNEAILITIVGALAIRITRQFEAGRKMGKTHQNVLIFLKGNSKKATEKIKIKLI